MQGLPQWRPGGNQRRTSANYRNDFTPAVLANGKVIFSRWEYVDRPAIPIQSLWTINPDGTKLEGLFGNRTLSPATFMEAREIPGGSGKILCLLTSHGGECRGAIGIVDPAVGGNAQRAIQNLTPEYDIGQVDAGDGNPIRGLFLNPFPVNGEFQYSKYTSWIPTYNGQEANILDIAPGRWGARASLLATVVERNHPDKDGQPRITLSRVEKARIYAWIDLNCPYYGTSD